MKRIFSLLISALMLLTLAACGVDVAQGLAYERNSDGSYTVVGIGTCMDEHVVIPRTHLGAAVTSIGDYAFFDCDSLTSITIPDSVTSIGDGAFSFCKKLTSITIPSSVTSIGTQIFYKADSLHTVYYNSLYAPPYYKEFLNEKNIKKVVFGGEVVPGVCSGCTNVEEVVVLYGVTSIDSCAFHSCTNLTSITIPDSVTSIGQAAFHSCTNLTSITIPNSVTSIGMFAFEDCDSLTSIVIPDSVTSIGLEAFFGCFNLTSITYTGTVKQWKAITLGNFWNEDVPATEVICSDGTVGISN